MAFTAGLLSLRLLRSGHRPSLAVTVRWSCHCELRVKRSRKQSRNRRLLRLETLSRLLRSGLRPSLVVTIRLYHCELKFRAEIPREAKETAKETAKQKKKPPQRGGKKRFPFLSQTTYVHRVLPLILQILLRPYLLRSLTQKKC